MAFRYIVRWEYPPSQAHCTIQNRREIRTATQQVIAAPNRHFARTHPLYLIDRPPKSDAKSDAACVRTGAHGAPDRLIDAPDPSRNPPQSKGWAPVQPGAQASKNGAGGNRTPGHFCVLPRKQVVCATRESRATQNVTHRIPPGARGAAAGREHHPFGLGREGMRRTRRMRRDRPRGPHRPARPAPCRRSGPRRWLPCRPTTPRAASRPKRGSTGPSRSPTRHGATTPAASSWPQRLWTVSKWRSRHALPLGLQQETFREQMHKSTHLLIECE